MKKSFIYTVAGLLLTFVACDPIEDRDSIGNLVDPADFKYSITQTPGKDYELTLKNETPGVLFSWNYTWDMTLKQHTTVQMLSPGTYTIKITATTAGGLVFTESDPIVVTQENPNAFLEPQWAMLTNKAQGKTWVWDTDKAAPWGNGGFKGCTAPCWWALTPADLDDRGVLNDEMTFNLSAGKNLMLNAASVPAAGTTAGSFDMDLSHKIGEWSNGKLITKNVTVINGINPNAGDAPFYEYYILKLTDTELHLSAAASGEATGDWGEAWFWMFKPKE